MNTFKSEWWQGKNRYDESDVNLNIHTVSRWLSFEDGQADGGMTVFELQPDFRLVTRYALNRWNTARVEMLNAVKHPRPELVEDMEDAARAWNYDGKLRGVIFDGIDADNKNREIRKTASKQLEHLLVPFQRLAPDYGYILNPASRLCEQGCVLLPETRANKDWVNDLELQLYNARPKSIGEVALSFARGVYYLEHLLDMALNARQNASNKIKNEGETVEALAAAYVNLFGIP